MMGEENQLENLQDLTVDSSGSPEEIADQTMSTEADLNSEEFNLASQANDDSPTAESSENGTFTLEPDNAASESEYQAALEELSQEVESLRTQVDDRTNQYVRIAADFDNFRRRAQKEKEELEEKIKCSTITELLPVVDNFERARSHIKPQNDGEMNIHKSYQSVYKQLVDCLKRVGVSPMRSEGKDFDPNLHEAVMREATDEHPEGTVVEELVRGYMLGDRVLRHAMVKVAAAPDPVVTSEESDRGHGDS
ncbi:nucleotide exchange factor GrpE [Trichocoleus sp. FACHB-591]|uniref:nucleotide exchange factor GrpE n=1 Tax=Trichocoleus sp. FACHB-591 TaxID=2692872 RepID=UPI001688CC37|nr:nucleotide exchange factor GrpE [Trichocoleus sp. FACHB-591]